MLSSALVGNKLVIPALGGIVVMALTRHGPNTIVGLEN